MTTSRPCRLRLTRLTCIAALLGAFAAPNGAFATTTYTLAISFFDESVASLVQLNGDGELLDYEDFPVGYQSWWVSATPNGQAVVVASTASLPKYTAAFLTPDGRVRHISYQDFPGNKRAGPMAMHPTEPLLYGGGSPCRLYRIDYQELKMEDASSTSQLVITPYTLAYSGPGNGLLYRADYYPDLYLLRTDAGGRFTGTSVTLHFDISLHTPDYDLSPDGRLLAVLFSEGPQLALVRVGSNGSLTLLAQDELPPVELQWPDKVRFTPDGKFLVVISHPFNSPRRVTAFALNRETGELTETGGVDVYWDDPQELAITPDGRWVVVMTPLYPNTVLRVIRLHEDGSLEWTGDKDILSTRFPSDMEFVPPWSESYPDAPNGAMMH